MISRDDLPETPDWSPQPRSAPVFDLVTRIKRELLTIPDNIELGTE